MTASQQIVARSQFPRFLIRLTAIAIGAIVVFQ